MLMLPFQLPSQIPSLVPTHVQSQVLSYSFHSNYKPSSHASVHHSSILYFIHTYFFQSNSLMNFHLMILCSITPLIPDLIPNSILAYNTAPTLLHVIIRNPAQAQQICFHGVPNSSLEVKENSWILSSAIGVVRKIFVRLKNLFKRRQSFPKFQRVLCWRFKVFSLAFICVSKCFLLHFLLCQELYNEKKISGVSL